MVEWQKNYYIASTGILCQDGTYDNAPKSKSDPLYDLGLIFRTCIPDGKSKRKVDRVYIPTNDVKPCPEDLWKFPRKKIFSLGDLCAKKSRGVKQLKYLRPFGVLSHASESKIDYIFV